MWIKFMLKKMHRGLKIREGFLAKHILSFAEHRRWKNLEFAKPNEQPPGLRSLPHVFRGLR